MSNDFVNNELEQKLQKALEESSTFTTIVNEEIYRKILNKEILNETICEEIIDILYGNGLIQSDEDVKVMVVQF